MGAYSTLSALTNDSTLTNGAVITHTEHNTHRTNYRSLINDLLTAATEQEKNRAGAAEPTDSAEGIIYCDTTNDPAQLKFYKDGAANLFTLASLEALNVFTVNQTFSAKIICGDTLTVNDGSDLATINVETYSATPTHLSEVRLRKSASATVGTLAETADGEFLGTVYGAGVNSSSGARDAGAVRFKQRGASGASNVPGDILFMTATASAGVAIRAGVSTEGNLFIGSSVSAPTGLVGGIAMLNGTAASAALANGISAWAADDAASKSELVVMSEGLTKYHLGGSADEDVRVGGVVDRQFTQVGNVGAGEDTLMTYTLPANALDVDGKGVRIIAWGGGNTIDNVTIKIHFGASSFVLTTGSAISASWSFIAHVIRSGATSQKFGAIFFEQSNQAVSTGTPAETLSGTVVIKVTGENTSDTSNDAVFQEGMIVELLN